MPESAVNGRDTGIGEVTLRFFLFLLYEEQIHAKQLQQDVT